MDNEDLPGLLEVVDLTAAFGAVVMLMTLLAVWFGYAPADGQLTQAAFFAGLVAVFGEKVWKAIQ